MERIAAVVAKLACILVAIGSGKGTCADPLELRKIQGRTNRDAMPLQDMITPFLHDIAVKGASKHQSRCS